MELQQMVMDFKGRAGFQRLFSAFHEKYKSFGYLNAGIKATIKQPTQSERDDLFGIMGIDYSNHDSITITVKQFEKAVSETKYASLLGRDFTQQLVQAYVGKTLVTKKEMAAQRLTTQVDFFESYAGFHHPKQLRDIIRWATDETNKGNRFLALYKKNPSSLGESLDILSKLFHLFPLEEPMYLPVFASKATQNPHTLDMERAEGKLLIYALQVLMQLETGEPLKKKLNAEDITELFLHFNILRDDLSNYVTLFNVEAENKNGSVNALLQATSDHQASINFPLKEVLKLGSVRAKGEGLFMMENSSVSSYLMDESIRNGKDISILSGNGQLRVATLKFLDLYTQSGGIVWYAGDYDPEGLGIAQRLLNRYGHAVRLWNYSLESYQQSLSDEEISKSRLQQLEQVTSPELADIKEAMLTTRYAGYQENVLEGLLEFGDSEDTAA